MREVSFEANKKGSQRRFSIDEKRRYCIAWEGSDLSQIEFCKMQGISKSALSQWYKAFKEGGSDDFVPLSVQTQSVLRREGTIRLELCLPNQLRLTMEIHSGQLSGLLQELSHAASAIR